MRKAALVAALALTAGCGSTVQSVGTSGTTSGDSLSAPGLTGPSAAAVPGTAAGASSGGLSVPEATGTVPGATSALGADTTPVTGNAPAAAVQAAADPTAPIKIGMLLTKTSNAS